MKVDSADVRQRFKAVAKCFPLWRIGFDMFFDLNSWRMIGADITSMLIESKSARRAAQAMAGATSDTLDAMLAVAKVNEHRSNDIFRAVFLGYVSMPVALAALLSDAAPDMLRSMLSEYASGLVILIVGSVLFPLTYFAGNWRAKQIAWVIELCRAGALTPLPETNARR